MQSISQTVATIGIDKYSNGNNQFSPREMLFFDKLQDIHNRTKDGIAALCNILGYQQGEAEGINALRSALKQIWGRRSLAWEKHWCPTIAIFGTKGQGKTEFCRQAVLNCASFFPVLPGVKYMIGLHVTFNQPCAYPMVDEDKNLTIFESVIWRILFSIDDQFVNPSSWNDLKCTSLETVFREMRSSVAQKLSILPNEIAILLLMDEVLQFSAVNESRLDLLLNQSASLQQREISQGKPTFFAITSQQYWPMQNLRIKSGRSVTLIPLTVMSDDNLRDQSLKIANQFHTILSMGDPNNMKLLNSEKIVQYYVNLVVWTAGKHFRSLEMMIFQLYRFIVSQHAHSWAVSTTQNIAMAKYLDPWFQQQSDLKSAPSLLDLLTDLKAPKTRKEVISSLFQKCCKGLHDVEDPDRVFEDTMKCFFRLLVDPDSKVNENDCLHLEDVGTIFVKWRDLKSFRA